MKKKVEEQLKNLAKKISDSSEYKNVSSLKNAAKELYERLVVLESIEEHLQGEKQKPLYEDSEAMDSKSYREDNWFKEPKPVEKPDNVEEIAEPLIEKIKDLVAQMPVESQQVDELLEEVLPKKKLIKNELEDLAEHYSITPTFERKAPEETEVIKEVSEIINTNIEDKAKSLNDKHKQGLNIGLNDRLAFIKQLFNGNTDDYTRVISQINSIATFNEADTFIKAKVKPDYNYWLNKDKYVERFMAIVEKAF